jgi:ectoine hydroxylase-related dioxygenase (phytanoyl-CoA dioxygenase family)
LSLSPTLPDIMEFDSSAATEHCTRFNSDGYCVCEGAFERESIDLIREAAVSNYEEVQARIKDYNLSFGIGIKHGFKEIVQRHPMRFEMPYRMNEEVFDFVLMSERIGEVVSRILECDDFIVANRSLVVSLPGCGDQGWHSDGPHMSATKDLPCHCLNVFIPLVDVNMKNGPTEFRPGSHYYTRNLAKSLLLAKVKKTLRPVDSPSISRGSVLMVRDAPSISISTYLLIHPTFHI